MTELELLPIMFWLLTGPLLLLVLAVIVSGIREWLGR